MKPMVTLLLLLPRLVWWAITGNWAPFRAIWHQAKIRRNQR